MATDEPQEEGQKGGGGNKALLWFILVLDVLALGGWLYLQASMAPEAKRAANRSRRGLINLRAEAQDLQTAVLTIQRDDLESVQDPGNIIQRVTQSFSIQGRQETLAEYMQWGKPNSRPWSGNSNYTESQVWVSIKNQLGLRFQDLLNLGLEIEKRNPKIQIFDMNFGRRDAAVGEDNWRPYGRFMGVRAFAPREN